MASCYQACHRHVAARAVPMLSHGTSRCTSCCIHRCHPACFCGCMGGVAAHGVPVLSHGTPRSIRPCIACSRSTCRRLASNTAGLWPSPRSPGRWLLVQQRHRAAIAGSGCGRQMRKARLKGAAPRCAQCQSARGGGAARAIRRLRAASSPNALQALGIPCAASDRARWACLEPHHEPARKLGWR